MIGEAVRQMMKEALDESVYISNESRQRVSNALYEWLAFKARKKPVADLDKRLETMQKRIDSMCRELKVEFVNGSPVVMVTAAEESTLLMFKRGTVWFDPHEDVTAEIVNALLV